jgi:ribose-phosphate pyrophosphokinase
MVDFGYLLCTLDAVDRLGAGKLGLYLPYFPGARQDHPEPGTPNTLRIFASLLNAMGHDVVVVVDPHSRLVGVHLDRCVTLGMDKIASAIMRPYNAVICPDKGAVGRAEAVASALHIPSIMGRKVRDPRDGKLSGFEVDPLPGMGRYLVVDDICDGGGTFIGLAQEIRKNLVGRASILDLYVTHGVFSKGFKELNKHYEEIITTDSLPLREVPPRNLTVIELMPWVKPMMEKELA